MHDARWLGAGVRRSGSGSGGRRARARRAGLGRGAGAGREGAPARLGGERGDPRRGGGGGGAGGGGEKRGRPPRGGRAGVAVRSDPGGAESAPLREKDYAPAAE